MFFIFLTTPSTGREMMFAALTVHYLRFYMEKVANLKAFNRNLSAFVQQHLLHSYRLLCGCLITRGRQICAVSLAGIFKNGKIKKQESYFNLFS